MNGDQKENFEDVQQQNITLQFISEQLGTRWMFSVDNNSGIKK